MDPQYPGGYNQGPQQNYGYPNSQGDGQYDFFMNQGPPPKKSLLPTGNTPADKLKKIVIFGVGLFALFVAILVFYSFITGSDKDYPLKLTGIIQTQQEVMRIAGEGSTSGRSIAVRNKALNTELTILTDQTELKTFAQSTYKLKINDKTLGAKADEDTDEALANAVATNRFDEVFTEILDNAIAAYKDELQKMYAEAKTDKEKDIIQRSFDHMELLSTPSP